MKRLTLLSLLLVLTLVIAACSSAEPAAPAVEEPVAEEAAEETMAEEEMEEEMVEETSNSIVDIAVNDGRFETLVAAVTAAGLAETLSGEGPFTVFAPTDDAFAALPEGTVESLLEDPQGALTNVLLYHVVDGKVMASDVVGLEAAPALSGEEIAINASDEGVFLNENVAVIITDIEADNGVIHVVDAVLLPPSMMVEEEMPSIAQIAADAGSFNTLLAALEAAGLAETFAGEGNFTVFAPTDDAFAALPEGTVEALLEDPQGALTDILTYHVVDGKVMASDVVALDAAPTLSGKDISIMVDGDSVILNENVMVTATDIEASNGVIHVIDAVLLPPAEMAEGEMSDDMMAEKQSIAAIAAEAGTFNTLLAALEAAGLAETFAGEGSFTVFAPTDDAFAALPEGTVEALLEDPQGALTDILTYHVVDGKVMASDVVGLDAAPTLNGKAIAIKVDGSTVFLNENVMVIATDIEASNGVIHVIDAVLLPPDEMAEAEMSDDMMAEKPSIAEIAVNDGNFNTLVAALDAAGLVETLSGEGEFTVFAPTDDAFAALPEGTIDALLADPQGDLTNILLYHVADGASYAEDVVATDMIPTLFGEDVSVTVDGDQVLLNDTVMVIATDIQASNGVIHVIDAVLIPAS